MPAATREGDLTSGHGCFPPTAITSTPASKTFINNRLASVIGALVATHFCGTTTHAGRTVTSGSGRVIIEGKEATRIGDSINCGDTVGQGSDNVIFG